jgi:AraC-like DNA-binding protein
MQTVDPYLSPRFVSYIRDFLLDQKLDPVDFLNSSEISLKNIEELSPVVNVSDIAELFEYVSHRLNKPLFGIELAVGFHYESSSMIVLAMLSSKDVNGLIQTLLKYDKYVDSAISLDFSIEDGQGCFSLEILSPKDTSTQQLSLYLISFFILALQRITRRQPQITKITFVDVFDTAALQQKLDLKQTQVEYLSRKNRVFFNVQYLKEPLLSQNELLHEVLCTTLNNYYAYQNGRYDVIDAVGREILIQGKKYAPSLQSVASALNMSESTLQRLLLEHKVTFKEMKRKVMMQRASHYLTQTNQSISEIAYELGYSEPSSFCRAFKISSGKTPDKYRVQNS